MSALDNFENNLLKWLERHGFYGIKVSVGTDFSYWKDGRIIRYSLIESEYDKPFEQFFYEYGCLYNHSNFVMSFLHELGHAITLESYTNQELDDLLNQVQYARDVINGEDVEEAREFNDDWYWHLPHEFDASYWAITYINRFHKEVMELEEIVAHDLCAAGKEFWTEVIEGVNIVVEF